MNNQRLTILDNEEYLRKVSEAVDFNDKSYLEDITKLKEFCQTDGIFALAPIQIGIPKRIIYLRSTSTDLSKTLDANYDESRVLINPVIIKRQGLTCFLEACASCPNINGSATEFNKDEEYLSCLVDRPYLVEVEYYDINGEKQYTIFKGFESTVLSHEYDHLNGILHIDLAKEIWPMTFSQREKYRKDHQYIIIAEDGDFDKLKNET